MFSLGRTIRAAAMWIQVRTMDGSETHRVDSLSKLTKVDELRLKISELFKVEPDVQRLFYRGKQMEDGHTIFDYNVGLNDIVQLLVRQKVDVVKGKDKEAELSDSDSGCGSTRSESDKNSTHGEAEAQTAGTSATTNTTELVDPGFGSYKINELVDARDLNMGAWFEAQILNVTKSPKTPKAEAADAQPAEEEILYQVKYEDYPENGLVQLLAKDVRPRARTVYQWHQLEPKMVVMVNFNPDDPKERGYWYDAEIQKKRETRTVKEIYAKILLGDAGDSLNDCRIMFLTEIYKIEEVGSLDETPAGSESPLKRSNGPECKHCKDNPKKNCQWCNCHVCGIKQDPDKQLLCDECDMAYHIYCLNPPLTSIPDDEDWYCPGCHNDASEVVLAGEKLKESKKKSKMASASSTSQRDWGKGMACVGRTTQCTIVPSNHYGPIPGVPVGSLWKFRVQVSESGVHRPHVAGIHGRSNDGAFSLVLAGGYEDDVDDGNEFTYTGSGGRDLSGNKRTAEQSCDQTLTHMNRALALNCNVPVNDKNGADAKNWKAGKPVRVVRSCKGRKHSKYCPEEGNRYDGIYKIAKYWPAKGKSGFLVWRYLLKRDDEEPAPWTRDGKDRVKKLGLTIQYPAGYQEKEKEKEKKMLRMRLRKHPAKSPKSSPTKTPKKIKLEMYKLTREQKTFIKNDKQNKKLWDEAMESLSLGPKFLNKVEEVFLCICCQEVVFQPITTECQHNVCRECLQRSFKADVHTCPACRYDLGKNYCMNINKPLQDILIQFFPGYSSGR
ncbi:hypothetical protein F7725_027801 [Dissostichus mawsoni]|uniref:E3 ubiquitin-protein ligase UHRF n=1 Tax=Dissostichus mawsoni TaxID=36200 RepID=A0A7J5XEG0_DISMA|nr:hypothetical protein F7725_027801 [Dissostichus mawsoni]